MSPTTVKERITRLETTVEEIKSNHLVHLASDVKELHDKLDKLVYVALSTTVGVLIDLALKFWQ